MKAYLVRAGLLALALNLAGCASTPPARPPSAQLAGIGISVQVRPPLALGTSYAADAVYFARTDERGDPELSTFYASNFSKDGRVYLLNVPAGRYVAVAARFTDGFLGTTNDYVTYLPRPVIEQSQVDALPREVAFAGRFVVDTRVGVCPDKADALQVRVAAAVFPGVPKCGLLNMILNEYASKPVVVVGGSAFALGPSTYHYGGIAKETQRSADVEREFLRAAQSDLGEAGWRTTPP